MSFGRPVLEKKVQQSGLRFFRALLAKKVRVYYIRHTSLAHIPKARGNHGWRLRIKRGVQGCGGEG